MRVLQQHGRLKVVKQVVSPPAKAHACTPTLHMQWAARSCSHVAVRAAGCRCCGVSTAGCVAPWPGDCQEGE